MRAYPVLAALMMLPGCYLAHEREEAAPVVPTCVEAMPGDPPILPADPEFDVPPDARPTGAWTDTPPPRADAPALIAIGEPTILTEGDLGGGLPSVVWDGCAWGVAWSSLGRHFLRLDEAGRPARDIMSVGPTVDPPVATWTSLRVG